ncbi:hypothetical protein B9Z55_011763 [Caenorhabditis nigoni]|uniref:Uncharacterized protein n=1 Tax=Caenorhabditis nigoni TaxID=1611254 RepID=A0A2G5ULJ6_9PELO|nr:hypothetical protein B9Z55_011763 [Caenorhabditis nigoni]
MLKIFSKIAPRFPSRCLSTFIEEEYFEDYGIPKEAPPPKSAPEDVTKRFRRPESEDVDFVETIVGALGEQKARDVFVVKSDDKEMTPYSHRIICSVFNSRQAAAISENLREILKIGNEQSMYGTSNVKSNTKRSNGWYVSEIDRVQVSDFLAENLAENSKKWTKMTENLEKIGKKSPKPIHVMSEDCREKYDLEAVWSGDDRILEQIDELKNRILLPPKRFNN